MILHPIFARELKRAVRNPILFWLRTGAVLVGASLGFFLLHGTEFWNYGAGPGREIFQIAVWTVFAASLLSGVLLTASSLCEERREGSLALLFLTEVRGFDIIAG